jgi:hypothetical protein
LHIAVTSIRDRAERRFELLRRQADSAGPTQETPSGWCISTIARLVHNGEPLIAAVLAIQSRLLPVGELYRYPRESLHISLLGCTQREPVRPADHSPRMDGIAQALDRAGADACPVSVELGRLNLVGTQFFIEVLTDEPTWRSLRERLARELTSIGESPMAYTDFEPMHLNIARILGRPDPEEVRRLLTRDRPAVNAALELATVELVVTDFVVTPATLTVVRTKSLRRD